ncbi:unnamed protein product [Lymnaea stagnalis]|uniref:KANSL3 helical domain-containing protein n=1 Tax=Lymnaea stagnalis TaxID=6523 RepID=A0AAV2GZ78_LYMST
MSTFEEHISTPRFLGFSQKYSNELNVVTIDHCYAKPWSSHPDASNARPLQMLFMDKFPRATEKQRSPDIIEVADSEEIPPMYDVTKARALMSDCERHASQLRPDYVDSKEDWEDHIANVRTSWSVLQNRIFAKVMRVLQADRLARLSITGTKNEPIQRRLQIDKAAKRVRFAFANIGWEMTLILWLHNLFLENLRGQLLTSYLEVLQTLKVKIPSLVERLIHGTTATQGSLSTESLGGLLKRTWDPVLSVINQQKLKKLPDNPLMLVISSNSSSGSVATAIKRLKFWQSQLAGMGKVINVVPVNTSTSITIANYVENMIATTRSKILEMKSHFPGRPIILIGWQVGALVATHVALMEVVQAVVCLGFPTMGVCGNRGEIDDQIYNCRTPTLFVVGQNASSCVLDTLEDIRERLRVDTGLVLLGGADDQLRMSRAKKRSCGVTQSMVDRCIMDEMFQFLGNILSQAVAAPENTVEETEVNKKQRKRKQKDISSAASSQTTEHVPKQTGVKTIKSIKIAKTGTVTYSSQLGLTGQVAKRASPKKRSNVSSEASNTKPMLHLSFPMIAASTESTKCLSKVSEAAAIASAPELSNLLQSIKPTYLDNQKPSGPPTPVTPVTKPTTGHINSTIPSTTALTLSRFLASSGFFRTGTLIKSAEAHSDDSEVGSKSSVDSSPEKSENSSETSLKQPQILIRTGTTSAPFSIPLTLTMASKVLKSSPLMKITGSSSTSAQIQQLFTSISSSAMPIVTSTMTTSSLHTMSSFLSSAPNSSSSSAAIGLATLARNCSTSSSGVTFSSPAVTTTTTSLGASVIDIGGDKVSMKETPPSTTAPCTVSIDLGQITTLSNTSNVMKLIRSSSKISLIPNVKQFSGPSEKLVLTSPQSDSQPSIATLSSLSHIPQAKSTKDASAITPSVTTPSVTTPSVTTPSSHVKLQQAHTSDATKTFSVPTVLSPSKISQGFTTTQHLSPSTGLITFKLSGPSVGTSAAVKSSDIGNDETDGQPKINSHSKDHVNIQYQHCTLSPGTRLSSTGPLIGAVTKAGVDQNVSTITSKTFSTNPTSLIITPGNKLGTAQIVLQCRTTPALQQPIKTTTIATSSQQPAKLSAPSTPLIPAKSICTLPESVKSNTPAVTSAEELTLLRNETIGRVTSISSKTPVTQTDTCQVVFSTHDNQDPVTKPSVKTVPSPPLSLASPATGSISKGSKSVSASYTATPKSVLSTAASTRTRRIRTPKQYDL